MALRASSSIVLKVLGSEMWPVQGTLGDLIQLAVAEVSPTIWNQAFDLADLSWLAKLIPIETPRTYSISNYSNELLPSVIDLTVSRSEYRLASVLDTGISSNVRYGVSSGCLNPDPSISPEMFDDEEYLIGISRPLNFQLPVTMTGPVAMFAGGSGIAPFRGFWQARAQSSFGRNILFLGVQSRERFSYEHELREYIRNGQLELHTAFSRDTNGLVHDSMSRDLVEKQMDARYLDAVIVEQGRTVCDLAISKSQGGLGGHLYVCGSVAMYETIMSGIRRAIYENWTSTKESADSLLAKAFAERRFMLDIFMTPRPVSYNTPRIPVSTLAIHTGHRKGSKMLIGVHGSVYDITDFLPIHPGGTLIVQASAGLDVSKTFDDLAHTSNPEVMSLLSKYFVGHLATKPEFRSKDISGLYDLWYQYLRNCIESLTTLHFEFNNIMEDARTWFQGDLFNMGGVRKFYQFQSRLMQNGFSTLFGAKLQELHLKLTFALVKSRTPDTRVPDVIGIITRSQASHASASAANEIAQIGQFVCNSQNARFQENGVLRYARAVTELDVQFLEEVREDICLGMDAFDVVGSTDTTSGAEKHQLVSLSAYLLSVLERVALRLETFYLRLARETIYRPELEKNPARTRWNVLKRKIHDGSFFILTQGTAFNDSLDAAKPFRSTRHAGRDVVFSQVVSQAKLAVDVERPAPIKSATARAASDPSYPPRLAHSHTARATPSAQAPSSFEMHESRNALQSITSFMDSNVQSIRRLSQLPADLSFAHIMAEYGTTSKRTHQPTMPSMKEVNEHTGAPTPHRRNESQTSYATRRQPPSVTSSERSVSRSRENSADDSGPRLARRGTNSSVSSVSGLPISPAPGAQGLVGRPFLQPRTSTSTSMSSSAMPLPLELATRSRSVSRTRSDSEGKRDQRRLPDPPSGGAVGFPGLMAQPEFARRKASASSPRSRMVPDAYPSQKPLSQTSPSSVVHSGVVPTAHAASTRINERLLAEMLQQNDLILKAQAQNSATTATSSSGSDSIKGGLRVLRLAPAPALSSNLRTRDGIGSMVPDTAAHGS
jgi:cytochrome b involved in lipid metabolism